MQKLGNLFTVAEMQLKKERIKYTITEIIDRAILIRKSLDKIELRREK